jgi:hypothetical protein
MYKNTPALHTGINLFGLLWALKGRRFHDIIVIQKQKQDTLAKFKTQDICECFITMAQALGSLCQVQGEYFKGDSTK